MSMIAIIARIGIGLLALTGVTVGIDRVVTDVTPVVAEPAGEIVPVEEVISVPSIEEMGTATIIATTTEDVLEAQSGVESVVDAATASPEAPATPEPDQGSSGGQSNGSSFDTVESLGGEQGSTVSETPVPPIENAVVTSTPTGTTTPTGEQETAIGEVPSEQVVVDVPLEVVDAPLYPQMLDDGIHRCARGMWEVEGYENMGACLREVRGL